MSPSSRNRALAELQKAQKAKERRTRIVLVAGVSAAVLVIAGAVGFAVWRDTSNRPSLDAVRTFSNITANHVTTPVTYAQTPPVGGDHNPVWLNCGVYDKAVPNELAVHSLEHGAVWVTYRPDLPADQVRTLTSSVPDTYMVVSPMEGLKAPVVASAWGHQIELTGVSDPRLAEFVKEYRNGPQTPEPGAACTGGSDGTVPTPGATGDQPSQ